MNSKQVVDTLYGKIEDQHIAVDGIEKNLERFNPALVKEGVGDVINTHHEVRELVAENMGPCDFRGLVAHISRIYSEGNLYKSCADSNSNVIPQIDFTKAFIEEARGILYLMTAQLTESAMPCLQDQSRDHYLKTAADKAVECLEAAVSLSPEAALAKTLIAGAKKYRQNL